MSSSGLDWDSSPSSVDNNDAGSWLPIQSRKKQSKPTQQIPDSARKPSNLPYNKQFEKNTDNGRMASASHRPAKPIYVPVQKFTPQVKKTESAIPYKNIGTQASSTITKSRLINIAATTISESSRAVKSTKISPSTKAGKETAKSSKDDTGIYDLMMFVRAPNLNLKAGLNAIKSVHSRDGKSDLGPQAIIKKPIEVNQEFVKHRFLQGKKKKKVFSKIKKRILMERLQNQMKRLAISNLAMNNIVLSDADDHHQELQDFTHRDFLGGQGVEISEQLGARKDARTVSLSQFVTEEDISDESEYEEIIADIKKMFSPFGDLESIIIRVQSEYDVCSDVAASGDRKLGTGVEESEQQCIVFVTFISSSVAAAAATAINGSLSGGLPIVAGLCTIDAAGGGCEGMQRGIPIINKTKVELISSNKDQDDSSDALIAIQSDILTNLMTPLEDDTHHILRAGVGSEHDLYLECAVFPNDVVDEDETAEVLNDLRSLCEVFGHLSSVWIEKIIRTPSLTVETGLSRHAGLVLDQTAESKTPWVFIEYDTVQEAAVAAAALNGLCIGGEALLVSMYSYSAYVAGKCSETHCWDAHGKCLMGMNGDGAVLEHGADEGAVIAIRNYVTADDLESCCGDSEELGAIKRDLIDLTAAHSSSEKTVGKEPSFIRRVTIIADIDSSEDVLPTGHELEIDCERLAACVRYSSLDAATAAMLSLDGTLLGGSRLRAWVKRSSPAPQSVSLHTSASLSVNLEVLENRYLGNACSHVSPVIVNQIIALRNTETSASTLDGQAIAPSTGSSLDSTARVAIPIPVGANTKKTSSNIGEGLAEEAVFPVQSAYKEATLAPKLEKNRVPDSRHRIKVAEEEVDARVKEFLGSIATFQEKLKERDPLKAAAKRRFVMGIKQATNCVKAGLVKLLLLAPDSEASEALDSALDILLDQAEQNNVAALYCLNRRKLGKAVHSSMKQVVIAVIDADGAYENFKKIIAFINKPAEDAK